MIRVLAVVTAWVGLFWGCAPQADQPPRAADYLLVGVAPDYPPFEGVTPDTDEIEGFDVELISLICQANRWRFEIIPTPFDELVNALQAGELDIVVSALTITPEREALIAFSDPYFLTGQALVLPRSDTVTSDLSDLRGKRAGVVTGTTGSKLARATDGVLVFPNDDIKTALAELSRGNLEVVINDQAVSLALMKDHPTLWVAPNTLNSEYYGIAMRPDDSIRLGMLNDALAGIVGGYAYERLHAKWFGYPPMGIEAPDSVRAQWPSD